VRFALFLKAFVQIATMVLPWPLRRPILNLLPGFSLAPGSRIGLCLVLAERAELAPGASIGHFTAIHPIALLRLERSATIGRGNKIVGSQEADMYGGQPDRVAALIMGEHSAITRNHLVDCSDTIRIGKFALIAGWRSQIVTHSPDFAKSRQVTAPVDIGDYSFIGTACIILKGTSFPARSILGAGSVYSRSYEEEFTLYSGSPAEPVRQLDPTMAFFRRPVGIMRRQWEENGETFGG